MDSYWNDMLHLLSLVYEVGSFRTVSVFFKIGFSFPLDVDLLFPSCDLE